MSLATRCPVCQTVFRVVQDQLKVSEGWVRCGRCAKVFNAFEGLFDLEREFPALRQPTPSQRVLEDLATRNRQPRSPWQEEFDNGTSGSGETAPPTPAATSQSEPTQIAARAGANVTTVPAAAHRSAAAPPGTPLSAPRATAPTASSPAAPPVPAAASTTVPRETAPWAARVARPPPTAQRDEGATVPPITAAPGKGGEPVKAEQRPVFAASAPAVNAQPTTPPAAQPQPTGQQTPTPQQPAAPLQSAQPQPTAQPQQTPAVSSRASSEIAIRDEPIAAPGGAAEADADAQDESFDALFRSDGELAQGATAIDDPGVDIMLDGADVEPASLDPDDAVDSRLLTFVQEADRAERWRRPWVRTAIALSVLGLVLLLAVQLLVAQRDVVVAQWPGTRGLVQSLCAPLNCRIEPLRRIDQVTVDSSGLTRIDDGPVYRLVLVLHNRADTALLMPAIDLSLTDAAGVLVSRRMLSANDLGSVRSTIAAGQEVPLQALLMSADRALTGYTIEIFYP